MHASQLAIRSVTVIALPLLVAGASAAIAPAAAAAAAGATRPAVKAAPSASAIKGQLRGVAATSAKNAWAVGSTGTTRLGTLIMHWNGKAWKRVPSPSPPGSMLRAVATTSAGSAWAVGCGSCLTSRPTALIMHWNGKAWKQVPGPGGGTLSGVAATSSRDAWAVGSASTGRTLVVRWNGKTWKRMPSPSPSSAKDGNSLTAVAAVSASAAWAVGYTTSGGANSLKSLILRWDGKAWKRVSVPTPTFGKYGYALQGVAATSATSAWAVGCTDGCPVGGTPLIERWRGTSWKQVAAPTKPYALYNLEAVAATSAGSAWAVGGGGPVTSESAATARWNGSKWTLSRARSGAGLAGVTAVSATDAWAVGSTAKGYILILRWTGSAWKLS